MQVDLKGLDRLLKKLRELEHVDAAPLMANWAETIIEDNRAGVLAGTDKDGNPTAPVTYRPKGATPLKPSVVQRNGARANARFGRFGGRGPLNAGLHNNLTPAEYRKLAGPPLAPRGAHSRVITNFKTSIAQDSPTSWTVTGAWDQVVDPKGRKFLGALFSTRDLRGVRPEGMAKARQALIRWARDLIRFGG